MHDILQLYEQSLPVHRINRFQNVEAQFAFLLIRPMARYTIGIQHLGRPLLQLHRIQTNPLALLPTGCRVRKRRRQDYKAESEEST